VQGGLTSLSNLILKVKVNSRYFSEGAIAHPQPYILSIAQIFEFVNTFLKKIFSDFRYHRQSKLQDKRCKEGKGHNEVLYLRHFLCNGVRCLRHTH
jgi:hypothetical protein